MPKECIENLLCMKQICFPQQPLDWDHLLNKFVICFHSCLFGGQLFEERLKFLLRCGLSDRVEALAFKFWRDNITNMIHTANFLFWEDNSFILHKIQRRIVYFEDELRIRNQRLYLSFYCGS